MAHARTLLKHETRLALARLAIILTGAGLIALLSFRIDSLRQGDPRLLTLVVGGLFAAAAALRYGTAERGLLVCVLCAPLLSFVSLPTGRESRVVISFAIMLGLLSVWVLKLMLRHATGARVRPSPLNKPVLIFVGVNAIAYVWSYFTRDPLLQIWDSFPFVQLAAFVLNITLPLSALYVINTADAVFLRRYLWFMVAIGAVNLIWRLFKLPFVGTLLSNGTNGLFGMWVAMFAAAALLYLRPLSLKQRAFLLTLLLLSGLLYFWRQRIWLSGWLPLVAGLGILSSFYSRRLTLLFGVALAGYVIWNSDVLYRTIVQDNIAEGGLQRLDIWRMNLGHVMNHPVFGMGPAGYAIYNMTYHPRDARSTHNNYFDVLAQTGVVGLIAFAALAVTALAVALRARRAVSGRGDVLEVLANAALAGLPAAFISMMLGDWVLPFAYNVTIMGFDHAVHTWLVMGVAGWIAASQAPAGDEARARS